MEEIFENPVAADAAAFLKTKADETLELVGRAEQLAQLLKEQPRDFIVCHADIHAWNLLIADDGALYMVDWDTLIYAPKERDLMFVGSGLGGHGRSPQDEEAWFYQGYGSTQIDPIGLAYYRYERILEDIAVFCEQIFLADEGGEDRKQALEYLESNFLPNGVLEIARRSDKTLMDD
jgi:spectinomycin phosphotransferase